ncbi:hypothetical protein [Microcystis phage Mae-JY24]
MNYRIIGNVLGLPFAAGSVVSSQDLGDVDVESLLRRGLIESLDTEPVSLDVLDEDAIDGVLLTDVPYVLEAREEGIFAVHNPAFVAPEGYKGLDVAGDHLFGGTLPSPVIEPVELETVTVDPEVEAEPEAEPEAEAKPKRNR